MTTEAALQSFFDSFGIGAYPACDVPSDAEYPYLSYEQKTGVWGQQAGLTVNLWYYAASNTAINAKARELSDRLGLGGVMLDCDGGAIWLTRGSPWCQAVRDDNNPDVKRRYINVTAAFLTAG